MKTVVGLMNNREEAQNVVQDLVSSGFQRDAISIMASDKERAQYQGEEEYGEADARTKGAVRGAGAGAALGGVAGLVVGLTGLAIPGIGAVVAAGPIAALLAGAGVGAVAGGAIGALTKMGVPEEDAQYYAEGVKRGGYLVTVSADDDSAEQAADIMRRNGAIDIDKQAESWRQEGWTRFQEREEGPYAESRGSAPYAAGSMEREGVIPVVEEEIQVGKRQVQTGGVRVYSHIVEVPVQEEIRLREERASVERRPVDRPATEAETEAFRERSFEIRETAEEPVIAKQARVKEEIIVGKEATERTEVVRDTLRHTEVEVEQRAESRDLGGEWASDDEDFHRHFDTTYGPEGERFESYRSAYHFAEGRSVDPQLRDKDWPEVEEVIHRDWENSHSEPWTKVKEAIHFGWDKVRKHH